MAAFIFRRDALVWTPAWLTIGLTGALETVGKELPAVNVAAGFTGTLFPFVMLAGALRFSERAGERWVLAAGVLTASARLGLEVSGFSSAAHGIALAVDPLPLFAAGAVVLGFAAHQRPLTLDILVGPGLFLLGGVELYSGYRRLAHHAPVGFPVWIAFVTPLAIAQFYAAVARSDRAREAAARALAANEARFQLITEHSLDVVSEIGPDGRMVYASPNHRQFGLDPDEIVGKRLEELGHVLELDVARADRWPRTGEGTYETVTKTRRSNGEIGWFESRSTAMLDSDGGRHVVSISRDVTDRVRAEESMRRGRERLRSILASLPKTRVTVLARDLTVHTLLPEDATVGGHGIQWSEVDGEKVDRFVADEDVPKWQALVADVLASGETRQVRQEVTLPEAKVWYDTFLSPFAGDEWGETDLVLAVSHDVTDQVRAEEERREFELRREQAQKFESLGRLASGIAHDFNNLLVGIAGNIELARRRVPDESELTPRLRDVATASRRAAELTEQLLAYAGKANLRIAPLDLSELVGETVQMLRGYGRPGVDLVVEAPESHPWISGDATQVGQVVMNLVTNAAEAVSEAGGRIVARTGVMSVDRAYLDECHPGGALEPGRYAFVEIEDDGPGLTQEGLARAFEPFYSSHGLGRGLGLAVVLGIVRSHGGTVHVESAPGFGTRFRVLFSPTESASLAIPPAEPSESPRGSGTVLVVDDEDSVREIAREFLEIGGFDVVEASRGAEAIDLFRKHPDAFRAALLDVSMPGMDGAETLVALRTVREDLPVVFMSGHSAIDMRKLDEGSARTGRVRKPFGINDLQEALRSVIGA